jgi:hypothetical protein
MLVNKAVRAEPMQLVSMSKLESRGAHKQLKRADQITKQVEGNNSENDHCWAVPDCKGVQRQAHQTLVITGVVHEGV